ncbi:MAG: hypothetical protein KKB81_05775 [Candidatus Margulisbacteria bacterium]|nr:hypothetical protein [Candidatus Margulisiibacteriota bacterium]MBU1021845.1 hypothetical protein [Candidatus Margulisiibacteriota bacterium]MBU1729004.1 hypothetical protein [Candidatus Margulisiibacteriota bacterium]MBU1954443.1 hypothetical protein [Candidatus Margulisiibacteriota bacterium]
MKSLTLAPFAALRAFHRDTRSKLVAVANHSRRAKTPRIRAQYTFWSHSYPRFADVVIITARAMDLNIEKCSYQKVDQTEHSLGPLKLIVEGHRASVYNMSAFLINNSPFWLYAFEGAEGEGLNNLGIMGGIDPTSTQFAVNNFLPVVKGWRKGIDLANRSVVDGVLNIALSGSVGVLGEPVMHDGQKVILQDPMIPNFLSYLTRQPQIPLKHHGQHTGHLVTGLFPFNAFCPISSETWGFTPAIIELQSR